MNYRHIYHAGNICDVVKHAVLVLLIGRLCEKDKPFCLLDTHAGSGIYDLHDSRARKTGEAEKGILRLLAAQALPELSDYYTTLQGFNPGWRQDDPATLPLFRFYPGSPFLAARLLRPEDRLVACELNEEDAKTLKYHAHPFDNTHIHRRDGYEALRAFLPPVEKRGLVVIDPPFEVPDEFDRLVKAAALVHTRWAQGVVMIWYPIKDRTAIWRFHESLAATGIAKQLCAEFVYGEETRHDQLNGCGFILINPPWPFEERLRELFPSMHEALQTPYRGVTVNWLTGDESSPVA